MTIIYTEEVNIESLVKLRDIFPNLQHRARFMDRWIKEQLANPTHSDVDKELLADTENQVVFLRESVATLIDERESAKERAEAAEGLLSDLEEFLEAAQAAQSNEADTPT